MRRRALLAIVFAGGMLSSQLPALPDKKVELTDSLIQGIANNTELTPEVRAYDLLRLASYYLDGSDNSVAEAQFIPATLSSKAISRRWESLLVPWVDEITLLTRATNQEPNPKGGTTADAQRKPDEVLSLADSAIQKSLTQLDNASDRFAKLNMYFIASRLFQKAGDTDGMHRCKKLLEDNFQCCERRSPVDDREIMAASSILNLTAYVSLPVYIPYERRESWLQDAHARLPAFTENEFEENEKVKLRAVAMVDRLSTSNHLRRKAHRDLALWYVRLGKTEKAEKEKQILFELVGCKDDSVLHPKSGGCGAPVWWWRSQGNLVAELCGMG